ncbi:HK97-gp10 family putative phage morphogenesis protein [Fervidibacillus albus]|uniref:Uncharacterized protein n=1 Tax=Fervidibacillus albus TaxID=2980026 RepID=A0A9E8LV92_9BACI|nr:HK97-gp10 family putative phage morphogenesis protein [Fervidibacillus albus]WAA10330.1 hypothetical protein OE104_03070 [Fervidibacillus albus]
MEFVSKVDRTKYLLRELERAALRDTAKLIRRRILDKARKLRGMRRGKRIPHAFQYWLRRREGDLQIGVKHDTWYGAHQELGTKNQPKRSIIRDTTYENIDQIRIIQGQYLKHIEDENKALGLINEDEEVGDEDV